MAVLFAGLWLWPDWTVGIWARIGRLLLLVSAGGAAYTAVLLGLGFRLRELRGV